MGDSGDAGNSEARLTRRRPTSPADSAGTKGGSLGAAAEGSSAAGGGSKTSSDSRRQRRRERERRASLSWPLLLSSLGSVAVSVLLAWLLLRPAAPPANLDPAEVASVVSAALVGQTGVVNSLLRHLRHARATDARRVDFLALGPVGTGKTLLTQALTSLPLSVTGRRLVGDVEIRRDRGELQRLAGSLVAAAPAGGWLLLALDDVAAHLAETVYLVEAAAAAAEKADVRLITLVTATSSDMGGERGAEATREVFARHSHLLTFRPLRRAGVVACVMRYAHSRGLALAEETAEAVAKAVKYEGSYAVNGCKPAVYHLRAALKLEDDEEGGKV